MTTFSHSSTTPSVSVTTASGNNQSRKRKLTAVCSHQTRIGNLDAHLI